MKSNKELRKYIKIIEVALDYAKDELKECNLKDEFISEINHQVQKKLIV